MKFVDDILFAQLMTSFLKNENFKDIDITKIKTSKSFLKKHIVILKSLKTKRMTQEIDYMFESIDSYFNAFHLRFVQLKTINAQRVQKMFILFISISSLFLLFSLVSFILERRSHSLALKLKEELQETIIEITRERDKAIVAQKVKGDFLSNMSHELRTPLNAILGFSEMLKNGLEDTSLKTKASLIYQSSNTLLQIINDILDLSKIESGRLEVHPQDTDALRHINNIVESFQNQVKTKKLDFKYDIDSISAISINYDALRISQILNNLISNAIKFSPESGTISLKVTHENSWLYIEVNDAGIGMTQEQQDRMFYAFEQADSSTTRKFGGTGLGLSIVKNLVELMDGDINVTSELNVGSTFLVKIYAPAKPKIISDHIKKEKSIKKKLNLHLLVAEDNVTNQVFIEALLEEMNITCDIAKDGVEAVKMYGDKKYDAVLMDENMPNLNGIGATQQIHKEYDSITPIVAVTANAMHGDRERFLEAGMDDFVSKPIDSKILHEVLKRLCN